ncbi:hypothetical protein TrST_g8689 [Triparma strigata]|uniref:CAP-Gly domain-containing protein n=1 Tax=Triparma strigata TaxID=1606541 RepID=A0A9W7EBG8_9STRA|nr:hypothetical protein TrST_g8689 [Triparma strigata]
MSSFAIHTAVEVQLKEQLVQGVVMFVGAVEFAAGDDWVGIRLTTGSLGLGKNDGSVSGKKYFEAGQDKNGIFVRSSQVKRREGMSRLDELKLKREIAAFDPNERRTSTSSAAGVNTASSSTSHSTSRLDALRAKRASLTQKKDGTIVGGDHAVAEQLTSQIMKLKKSLQDVKDDNEALRRVAEMQKEKMQEAKKEKEELESALREFRDSSRRNSLTPQKGEGTPSKIPNAVRRMSLNASTGVSKEAHAALKEELEEMTKKYEDSDTQVKWYQKENEKTSSMLSSRTTECSVIQKNLESLKSSRRDSVAKDAKTSASLQATVNSLTRKNQDLEAKNEENKERMETLTLDLEEVRLEKETLEEKVEELTLDYETAQIEVEELKEELESNIMDDEGGDTDEAQLKTENKRLREGLMRLRETSSASQSEMAKKLRQAEKAAEAATKLQKEVGDLRNHKRKSVIEIGELKEFVDSAKSFEDTVEDLSLKNLQLEDEVTQLEEKVNDLEEEVEMAAEMEEVQAEELSAALLDVQAGETTIKNLQEAIHLQREQEKEYETTTKKYRDLVADLKRERDHLLASMKDTEGDQSSLIEKSQQVLAKAAREAKLISELKGKDHLFQKLRMQRPISSMQLSTLEAFLPSEVSGLFTSALSGDVTLQRVCGASALGLEDLFSYWSGGHGSEGDEVSVDTKSALAACGGECKLGECFVDAAMASYRVMLALGMGVVEEEKKDDAVKVSSFAGGEFKEVESLAIRLVEKIGSDKAAGISVQDAELIDFKDQIEKAVQAMSQYWDSELPLIPADWNPQGIDQVRDIYVAGCLCSSVNYRLASFFTPEIAGNLKKLSIENMKLRMAINEEVRLGTEDTGEYLNTVRTVVSTIHNNFDGDDFSQISKSIEAAIAGVAKCLKSARSGGTGITALLPTSLNSFENSCKYLEDMNAEENVWTRRSATLQQKFLDGAAAGKKLEEIGSNFESTKAALEEKERELTMLKKKISQFEDMLAEGPGSAKEEKENEEESEKFVAMKNENAMLHEAMEVLHAQVEEYESELKFMKGGKGGKGKSPMRLSSRAGSMASRSDSVVSRSSRLDTASSMADFDDSEGAIQILRPLLRAARLETATWKNKALGNDIDSLPSLRKQRSAQGIILASRANMLGMAQPQGGDGEKDEKVKHDETLRFGRGELVKAMADLRLAKASSRIIKIGGSLEKSREARVEAVAKLEEVVDENKWTLKGFEKPALEKSSSHKLKQGASLAARVTLNCAPGDGNKGVIVGYFGSDLEMNQIMGY